MVLYPSYLLLCIPSSKNNLLIMPEFKYFRQTVCAYLHILNYKLKPVQVWNGKDKFQREVNSGVYFIHLAAPFYNKTIKGVMLK